MTATTVLVRLFALDVSVDAPGAELTMRPASVVPPELLAGVRARKAALLALLAAKDGRLVPPAAAGPERIDPAAIAADPSADEVETLAMAMATEPGNRITGRGGMDYF